MPRKEYLILIDPLWYVVHYSKLYMFLLTNGFSFHESKIWLIVESLKFTIERNTCEMNSKDLQIISKVVGFSNQKYQLSPIKLTKFLNEFINNLVPQTDNLCFFSP